MRHPINALPDNLLYTLRLVALRNGKLVGRFVREIAPIGGLL